MRRSYLIYAILAFGWAGACFWLQREHQTQKKAAHAALSNRAADISASLAVVIRAMRLFPVAAGMREKMRSTRGAEDNFRRLDSDEDMRLTPQEFRGPRDVFDRVDRNRDGRIDPSEWALSYKRIAEKGVNFAQHFSLEKALQALVGSNELMSVYVLNHEQEVIARAGPELEGDLASFKIDEKVFAPGTLTVAYPLELAAPSETSEPSELRGDPRGHGGRYPDFRERIVRAWGQNPEKIDEKLLEQIRTRGYHKFIMVMSTTSAQETIDRDFWLRVALAGVALVAALGMGLAWGAMERSIALRLDLIRTGELNAHLREKNVAAAGLAHETRNPLNIIRGLAQMISRETSAPAAVQCKANELIEEVDRITGRLNEFIEYSRPREPNPQPVNLKALVSDVARTLEMDREDKNIQFTQQGPEVTVQVDEPLFRQVLFNLVMNAFQAVPDDGEVMATVVPDKNGTAAFELSDNGPGVSPEFREEIFRPYVTMSQAGTGLGLAVVWQIVQAHGLQISCVGREGPGAVFRISGLKVVEQGA